jgi:superfamily II DNA/RNA helicase
MWSDTGRDLQPGEVLAKELTELGRCLREWPSGAIPQEPTFPHVARLAACLQMCRDAPAAVGWADLAGLVRQILRVGERSVLDRTAELRLTLPTEAGGRPWPTAAQWASCGVTADRVGSSYQVTAQPWRPSWSDRKDPVDHRVSGATFQSCRTTLPVLADPFLRATFPTSATDFGHYTSDAHQQAVRTVLACRPGSTIIVNLPTGAGKSTVALAPALARSQPAGTSLIIVPTVALALDQERRVRELLGDPAGSFAYSSSTGDETRARMRAGVRSGVQRLIFVSPESITRSLAPALFDAARDGLLRYFVVDEAHLVDQWGTEFRPEFQALAGMRRRLFDVQVESGHEPFRTLLMTATMPPSTADLLVDLFGRPGPVEPVIANALRPEPAFYTAKFNGWERRSEAMVDALRHLPRPAIVYSSRPSFARRRCEELRAAGFERVALFTGESSDDERRRVLQGFRDGKIDVVSATSAFGLGVDQNDIRTVVHACIPETIDRYYQEVGRSGRDGRASVSVLLWTEGDTKDAHAFSHPRVISKELGLDRWQTMLRLASSSGDGRGGIELPLGALRPALERYSEENEKWNVRVLGLLVRAGIIRPSWEDPRSVEVAEGEEFESDRAMVVELRAGALDDERWTEVVNPVRDRIRADADRAHDAMIAALAPGAATCELIRSVYDLTSSASLDPRRHHGPPALACGGCPAHPEGRPAGVLPLVPPVAHPLEPVASTSHPLVRLGAVGVVTYVPPNTRRQREHLDEQVASLLRSLLPAGVRLLVGPVEALTEGALSSVAGEAHLLVPDRLFLVDERDRFRPDTLDWLPALATMVICGPGQRVPHDWFAEEPGARPLVVVLPDDHPDPDRPDRRIVEMRPGVRSLSTLIPN